MTANVRIIGAVLMGALLPASWSATHGEELTASEILDRNQKAMAPPIQYRISTGEIESIVSMKEIGDRGLAVRMETVTPTMERVSLVAGDEFWTWDPASKTGDKLTEALAEERARALAFNAAVTRDLPNAAVNTVVREPLRHDDRKLLVVDTLLPPEVVIALARDFPQGTRKPRGIRLILDSETFETVERVSLFGTSDETGERSTVTDVRHNADLPDTLFLPPDSYTFTSPHTFDTLRQATSESDRQFVDSRKNMRKEQWEAIQKQVEEDINDDGYRHDPITGEILVDPESGFKLFRAPPGFTDAEYNRELTRLVLEDRLKEGNRDPGESTLTDKVAALKKSRLPLAKSGKLVPPAQQESTSPAATAVGHKLPWLMIANVAIAALLAAILWARRTRSAP